MSHSYRYVCCDLFASGNTNESTIATFPHIFMFAGSKSHLLTVSYSAKNFRFVVNTAEEYDYMASSIRFVHNKCLVIK